jgi:hypothetical protein
VVVTPDETRHAQLIDLLSSRGLLVRVETQLSADGLAAAGTVAFAPSASGDARLWELDETVPAAAFAVLAARRFLIVPRARVTFGLLPGVDHLAASTDDEVVQYADALHSFPASFALQAALGRVAAERQRASVLYGRLATAARRSAAPRG